MDRFAPIPDRLGPTVRLLFNYRGAVGRGGFLFAELARGVGLATCYGLYGLDLVIPAGTLVPLAVWPGVVATVKRFRDLGHDPLLILPVLMYLGGGFAAAYRYQRPAIGVAALGVYLAYVSGVRGRTAGAAGDRPRK